MTGAQTVSILKKAGQNFMEDRAMRLAAALACYTIISLAPLVIITMKVLSIIRGIDAGEVVRSQLGHLMGAGAEGVQEMVNNATQPGAGILATVVSLIILLFSASGVFAELQDSMNTIWEIKPGPNVGWWDTVKKRFFSMGMVFAIIFLLLVSMFITAALAALIGALMGPTDANTGFLARAVGYLADFIVTTAVTWGLFMLIFKYLPDVKLSFRDVWIGALVTAVLFKLGQYALTAYFYFGSPTSAYGAAGSIVAVLLWAYYSSCILFFGAEFTQAYTVQMGERIEPDEDAVKVTEQDRAQQGLPSRENLGQAAAAKEKFADRRGAPFPASAVPQRRVVTITRSTPDANKAYALAGIGLAAGFVVGAIGMLSGRKYTSGGIKQIALDRRLSELESRLQGRPPELVGTAIRVEERLDDLDARLRGAQEAVHRRRKEVARQQASNVRDGRPTIKERFDAAVRARKGEPNIFERLTGVSTKPTWWERLGEMVGRS